MIHINHGPFPVSIKGHEMRLDGASGLRGAAPTAARLQPPGKKCNQGRINGISPNFIWGNFTYYNTFY